MKIYQEVIKELNLMLVKFIGDFSVDEYIAFVSNAMQQPDWKYIEKGIIDLRSTNITDLEADFEKMVEFRKRFQNQIKQNVYLVDSPIITALTHIYITEIKTNFKYFSTIEKALIELRLTGSKYEQGIYDFLK